MTEINWSSLGSSGGFIPYDIAMGTVQDYLSEKIAPLRYTKVDGDPAVPVMIPATEAIGLLV